MVLLEPMSDFNQLEVVKHFLHFDKAAGFAQDKIWCLWGEEFGIVFTEHAEQLAHARIMFRSGFSFESSGVYAKCTRVGRRPLWEAMELLNGDMVRPWMAVGDFNDVSSAGEQGGRSSMNMRNVDEFNTAMFNCGLASVEFEGQPFTWTNGVMWQRLDRALVNA